MCKDSHDCQKHSWRFYAKIDKEKKPEMLCVGTLQRGSRLCFAAVIVSGRFFA
jgi:hypothetical protein